MAIMGILDCAMILLFLHFITITVPFSNAFPANYAHEERGILPRDVIFQKFKFISCNLEEENVIKRAFMNIRDMLRNQKGSLSDAKGYLNKLLSDQPPMLTEEIENKVETFMTFLGRFDYKDHCEVTENTVIASQVIDAVRLIDDIILDFAFSGQYNPNIFCGDEALQHVKTEGDTIYYKNTEDPHQRDVAGDTGTPAGKCDGQSTVAMMLHPTTGVLEDWMLLCSDLIKKWLEADPDLDEHSDLEDLPDPRYLSEYKSLSLDEMVDRNLDEIISHTPEVTLLHELTHSKKIFTIDKSLENVPLRGSTGEDTPAANLYHDLESSGQLYKILDVDQHGNRLDKSAALHDVNLAPGTPAYEFQNVVELSKVSRHNPIMMVRNAETIAYHAAAAYLDKCKWNHEGNCVDPRDA